MGFAAKLLLEKLFSDALIWNCEFDNDKLIESIDARSGGGSTAIESQEAMTARPRYVRMMLPSMKIFMKIVEFWSVTTWYNKTEVSYKVCVSIAAVYLLHLNCSGDCAETGN